MSYRTEGQCRDCKCRCHRGQKGNAETASIDVIEDRRAMQRLQVYMSYRTEGQCRDCKCRCHIGQKGNAETASVECRCHIGQKGNAETASIDVI